MKKGKQLWERIQALGMSQARLARALGITEQSVSGWRKGKAVPSAETYVKLGNLAQDTSDAVWFWKQAGLNVPKTLSVAMTLLHERTSSSKIMAEEGDVVLLSRLRYTMEGVEEIGPPIPWPKERISNPGATVAVQDNDFPKGFQIVEIFPECPRELSGLWGSDVLVHYDPEEQRRAAVFPRGIYVGRLILSERIVYPNKPRGLLLHAFLDMLSKEGFATIELGEFRHATFDKLSMKEMDASPEELLELSKLRIESYDEARKNLALYKGIRILGKVVGRC